MVARVRKYETAGRGFAGRSASRRRSSSFLALFLAEGSAERPSSQRRRVGRRPLSSLSPVVLFKFVRYRSTLLPRDRSRRDVGSLNDDASVGTARHTYTHTHIHVYVYVHERETARHTVRRPWCPARTEWKKERERANVGMYRAHAPPRTTPRARERVVSRPDRADPLLPPTTRRSFLPSAPAEFVKPKRHRRARTTAFRR